MVTNKNVVRLAIVVLLLGSAPLSTTEALAHDALVAFHVSIPNPGNKLFHVRAEVAGGSQQSVQLDWPAWTPGYATIWDYGQHVTNLVAKDQDGNRLPSSRLSENRWVIVTRGTPKVSFEYDVRAINTDDDLGFAQAYLDSIQGWYNGAALFPEIPGFRDTPQTVRFTLPSGWQLATAMIPTSETNEYVVSNYDELVDSPVQVGSFLRKVINVQNVPITIVVAGIRDVNMEELGALIKAIAENQFSLMGGANVNRYLFIFHAGNKGAGGLEHANAVTISLRMEEYTKKDSWLKVVTAHELFHLWNAKRIHVERFDRYDYSRPHRSKEVWFAEGITAYYTDLSLFRAGLMPKADLYKSLADILDMYENNPAHLRLSWEDISWYIWEEEIRQGLGVWLLPGWMIDLKIRDATDNRFSLDDVMRFLNTWYGDTGKGYPESGLGAICSAVAQTDISSFFRNHISGYTPFPYEQLFGAAGLKWEKATSQVPSVGCDFFWSLKGHVKAIGVEEGGPAYIAGIRTGDKILTVNGMQYGNRQEIAKTKSQMHIGDTLVVTFLRGDVVSRATIIVASRSVVKSRIVEMEKPTERQLRIREGILKGTP
ncbi:MAG: peptidase domain protein [Bacteroidetes bacterium]|nr:peptidase domain protein [Bacteroidota bacterium]